MILSNVMSDEFIIGRILDRIDAFDEKLDENINDLSREIVNCKLDIQAVQNDLTNHLNNKKDKSERSNRQFYIVTAIIGVIFSTYVTIKELF